MPNRKTLLADLDWALRGLGLEMAFQLIQRREYVDRDRDSFLALLLEFDKTVSPILELYLRDDPLPIIHGAESHLSFALGANTSPSSETFSYHRMLAGLVACLRGDQNGLNWLTALLITEPINRKLPIAYFLGNLTDGRLGSQKKSIPTRKQVLEWANQVKENRIRVTPLIGELAFGPKFKNIE
jgi:hypothetical protein